MLFGSAQNERELDGEDDPPLQVDDGERPLRPRAGIAPKAGSEDDVLLQSMDESNRGPRRP
jgi:hypothetical protein